MNDRRQQAAQGEWGAAAVEAALVLPLILLILFGTVQFGLAWYRAQNLEAAAREGARLASVGYTFTEVRDRVWAAQESFTDADIDVYFSTDGSTWSTAAGVRPCEAAGMGEPVYVRANVPKDPGYAIVIPLWGNQEIEFDAVGVFRCEETS